MAKAMNIARPAIGQGRRSFRERLIKLDTKASPYLYITPFFLLFAVFGAFPLVYTAWVSLTNRNLLSGSTQFVGLANYEALYHDSYFWNAVENTLGIWVLSTVPQLCLALVFAYLLNKQLRVRSFFRMSLLLPQVTSLVAVALIFTQLFDYRYGLINYVLSEIGIGKVDWEAGTLSSWFALSTMVTWRWVGYNALIYLAAMQAVPYELYESASIDGASNWRQLFHITIPSIRPTIIFTVIISTIGGLQLFTEPYEFQPLKQAGTGGSDRQYQTVAMYLYEKAFGGSEFKFGYASAIAWTLFLLIAVISLFNFLVVRRIRSSE
jgi:cellobiose transport system permease protein